MFIITLCFLFIVIVFCSFIVNRIEKYSNRIIRDLNSFLLKVDAIIIMGSGVEEDGNPSVILRHRLDTGIDLYLKGLSNRIFLTGDEDNNIYNEVLAMKKYVLNHNKILEDNIILDGKGYNTYSSLLRAKEVYNINSAIIVTNEYHLPRALYLGNKNNMVVYGVISDKGEYLYMDYYICREKLAQIKDFIKVNLK